METIRKMELEIISTVHEPSMILLILLADPNCDCDIGL